MSDQASSGRSLADDSLEEKKEGNKKPEPAICGLRLGWKCSRSCDLRVESVSDSKDTAPETQLLRFSLVSLSQWQTLKEG